jgi:hypothetical protein
MKPSPSGKVEIIRLVEDSHLPTRRTLEIPGNAQSSFYRCYDRYRQDGSEALADRPSRQTQGKIERWHQTLKNQILLKITICLGNPGSRSWSSWKTITTNACMRA